MRWYELLTMDGLSLLEHSTLAYWLSLMTLWESTHQSALEVSDHYKGIKGNKPCGLSQMIPKIMTEITQKEMEVAEQLSLLVWKLWKRKV